MKINKYFKLKRHDKFDKRIEARGPGDMKFWFDYDDVPYGTFWNIRKIIQILNENWLKK